MKTRIFLSVIFTIVFCIGLHAVETDICLYASKHEDKINRDRRSVTLKPTATIEGNVLTIQTALATENVEVYIKDSVGCIVYFSQSAGASRSHTFIIGTLPEGDYTLEVEIGDAFFYGYFSTDNDI